MSPGGWQRAKELLADALERAPAERAEFIKKACGDDEALRAELESLLAEERAVGDFLSSDAFGATMARRTGAGELGVGTLLGERYEILALLGEGGMGAVYKAKDREVGHLVALKVIRPELANQQGILQRFRQELILARQITHKNVIRIFDLGQAEGVKFITMEFVEGRDLHSLLRAGHRFTLGEKVRIIQQVCRALEAAHAEGVVHRDLKPHNIMVEEGGRVVVLDFGIARSLDAMDGQTPTGALLGTPAYMSLEQVRGDRVGTRSDLFSLGVIFYELLTGKPPYESETMVGLLLKRIQERPIPPVERDKEIPHGLSDVVLKCLAFDLAQRYQTASELYVDLEAWQRSPGTFRTVAGTTIALPAQTTAVQAATQAIPAAQPKPPANRWVPLGADVRAPRGRFNLWKWSAGAELIVSLAAGALVALAAVGYWVSHHGAAPGAAPRIQALAVLPLTNLSDDPAQEFLADGITEALIADLAQIGALRVISRTSVMQFKNSKKLLTEIARQLKVDAVVEASVLRSGNRVRITAELIDASTDRQLWAKTYERNLDDVLDLQNEVARAIAGEIQAKVTPREQSQLARSRTVNPGAVEAYLKCRFYWNKFTVDSLVQSIEDCQQAIKLDQNYGEAYAALAMGWEGLEYLGAVSFAEVRPKVVDVVTKALQIDNTVAEAHVALAGLKAQEWDWAAAETEIKKAIQLNPGFAQAHQTYSDKLRYRGRVDESIAESRRGVDLDPLAALANEGLADAYKSARQYDRAIEQYLTTLGLYPDQVSARNSLGWCYVYQGMYDQGIREIQKTLKSYGETPNTSDELAYIYAVRGQKSKARQILARLQDLAKRAPVGPEHFVLIYAGLGESDEALGWLEEAYQRHSHMMWWLKVDPRFDDLRPNPRFQELMRRVGLL